MRLDRRHIPWAIIFFIATAVAGAFYLVAFHPAWLPFPFETPKLLREAPNDRNTVGGTGLGIIYGTLAFLIFLFGSAFSVRKKKRLWRIGDVQLWLRAHIWLTLFTIPLVLFHCGFKAGGPHTTMLVVIYSIVMVSGIFGLIMQQFIPRMMKERLPNEVVYEQIPHIRERLFEAALELRSEVRGLERDAAVATETGGATAVAKDVSAHTIGDFMDGECLPYLRASRSKARKMRLADARTGADMFRLLRVNATDALRDRVDQMEQWCTDRREMDLQMKLHHWLHGWLLLHVPFSFALLVMTVWHIYIVITFL
jgi:hypothetical protein